MISSLLAKVGAAIIAPLVFLTNVFAPTVVHEPVGVAIPSATPVFETSLASPITAIATSMTLSSNSVRGGGTLSGYQCFTIDEGSAQAEYVCGGVSGTSVTSLERGLSPADGISTTTALSFAHRRGATVKITDFPLLQRIVLQNTGADTFEAPITYASGIGPISGSDLADKEYVLSAIAGTSTLAFDKTTISATAGETLATGTVVYLKPSDQRWYKTDNDDTTTYIDRILGITQGAGSTGNAIVNGVLTYGVDANQTGLTAGAVYFVSGTAGALTVATTSQPIGVARSASQLFVNPNIVTSSHYTQLTFTSTTTFSSGISGIGASPSTSIYTSLGTTTYTKPSNLRWLSVRVVGGGGGGAGYDSDDTSGYGAGGGAGAYAERIFLASQLPATTSIVVGGGGSRGNSSAAPTAGATGSTSVFYSIYAGGGTGGCIGNPCASSGGSATGGTVNITGDYGYSDASNSGQGFGGDSQLGGGGVNYSAGAANQFSCTGYGSGGYGAYESNYEGQSGCQGVVIITEYF